MLTKAPRGTRDILPEEASRWQYVEDMIRECCLLHGYGEIRLPLFEHTELFQRGVGEATDIVEKEMYTFKDRGGRSITLRPEATASTVRAYLEHNLHSGPQPVKMYYLGSMFRYDRPQAGRYRQFDQFGIEAIGVQDATIDAEVIAVALDLYSRLGLTQLEVQLNSIGCPKCRQGYRQSLLAYLSSREDELCPTCLRRLERNPLRVLDCKKEACRAVGAGAPQMLEYLCPECDDHFRVLQASLTGIGARYVVNPTLVRGLDYYTKTVFEITWSGLGTEIAICGGGRYDGLIEECGGPPTPAVGFAMGMERLLLALEKTGRRIPDKNKLVAYLATLSEEDNQQAFIILTQLRRAGITSDKDYRKASLRAQFRAADRRRAQFTVLVGGEELTRGAVAVRNMVTGDQREVPLAELTTFLQEGV